MKKLSLILTLLAIGMALTYAQEKNYLVFEYMRVEKGNTLPYIEYKDFLEKLYQESNNQGDIKGWDFWSLKSGAEQEDFHYLTVTYYNDPVKMMEGLSLGKLISYGKEVYKDMDHKALHEKISEAHKSRDLAVRSYMEEIVAVGDNFRLQPGVLASFDLMKAVEGRFEEYETAEKEVFLPIHKKKIENDLMATWRLLRTALPFGSEARSTHMTINIYKDYLQFFNSMEYEDIEASQEERRAVEKGLQSRDQKWVYLATLEKVVR
ncbi:hypothetical protein [Anditalea andensis]|uniref:NIPSNAP domain-containing protein n=1 Tax=Anditalea andensis TaxID=1048983 RepID=A0A074L1V9_9BACT|nr:hypothetical protein [Anditalea andensis]KEO73863.1 hypothetical protein EL17_10200 [Anditalea andensis]